MIGHYILCGLQFAMALMAVLAGTVAICFSLVKAMDAAEKRWGRKGSFAVLVLAVFLVGTGLGSFVCYLDEHKSALPTQQPTHATP